MKRGCIAITPDKADKPTSRQSKKIKAKDQQTDTKKQPTYTSLQQHDTTTKQQSKPVQPKKA